MHFFHQRITRLCIFLLLFIYTITAPEGFAPGTPVRTPTGFITIENLEAGHEVISFDRLKKIYAKNRVVKRHKHSTQALLHIHCGDTIVKTDAEQRFLDADTHTWHPAHAFHVGQRIVARDHDALTITDIQHKKFKEASALYALSLRNTPHNFCVTHNKIVAHNFEPLSLSLGTIYAVCSVIQAITQVCGAWQEGNSTANNLCEEKFQQLLDRNPQATLGDLAQDQSSKVSPEVVNQCIAKHGPATKLRDLAPQELKLFDERIGVQRALQTVKDQEQQTQEVSDKPVQNAKTSTSGTVSTLKSATASGIIQGTVDGTIQGLAQVSIGIAKGDVTSVGAAAGTLVKSIATNSVKNGGKVFGKTVAITACKKVAPKLTEEVLKHAPIIQQAVMIYTIAKVTAGPVISFLRQWTGGDDDGKGAGAMRIPPAGALMHRNDNASGDKQPKSSGSGTPTPPKVTAGPVMNLVHRWTDGDDDGKGSGAMRLPAARALMHCNDNASGGKQPKSSGSGTPTPPKDPDKDNKIKQLLDKAFETYKRDGSEEHLFGEKNIEKHGFDRLIKELIEKKLVSNLKAGKEFIATQLLKKVVENGIPATHRAWETIVRIGNYEVTVRTVVVNGAIRIGTAFIGSLFKR